MKKKRLIIGAIVLIAILAVLTALTHIGNNILLDNIEVTQVKLGSFQRNYKTYGTVTSNLHSFFYNGMISSVNYKETDYLHKDDVILKYKDPEGNEKELKSEIDGYLYSITADSVQIYDSSYYLTVLLKEKYYDQISLNSQHLFTTDSRDYLITVTGKKDYGIRRDGDTVYEVIFSFDTLENLKLNQQGNVTISLNSMDNVLLVDKRAVYETVNGYYLLDGQWLSEPDESGKYLIKVNIVGNDENNAVVEGVNLEGKSVCIINETIRKVLEDDQVN